MNQIKHASKQLKSGLDHHKATKHKYMVKMNEIFRKEFVFFASCINSILFAIMQYFKPHDSKLNML